MNYLISMFNSIDKCNLWEKIKEHNEPNGDLLVEYINGEDTLKCICRFELDMDQNYYIEEIKFVEV